MLLLLTNFAVDGGQSFLDGQAEFDGAWGGRSRRWIVKS